MAKTKSVKTKNKSNSNTEKISAMQEKQTAEQLYADALAFAEQGQHEDALEKAQSLWAIVQDKNPREVLPALNLLGEINVDLGDVDSAKKYFERAVALDPEGAILETSGGGAEKFLWLAQLSDEGGEQSVQWYEKGTKALQHEIASLESGNYSGLDDEAMLMLRLEKKRKLANALCCMVEVYMTDLSWENDAEARCESLITEAMSVEEETSAEVLQVLASVRLSQQRKEDAQSALRRSLEIWQKLDPEDPLVPDFPNRISLSRLLMEAEMEFEAMGVLNRLVLEDDQSVETWYLGGWCQYLSAERDREQASANEGANGESGTVEEQYLSLLKGSRRWLKMSIRLYSLLDYEDERLFVHAQEVVTIIDSIVGPEDEDANDAEDESDEEWEGIEDGDGDEEMQDA